MPYYDGTYSSPVQVGPKRVFFPFANQPTKDTTTKGTSRDYTVLAANYSPSAALSTDPDDATQYLIDESEPTARGTLYDFTRTYCKIPAQQIVYSSRLLVRPVMHDVVTASRQAVSFDDGQTSTVFSARTAVSSVGAITYATVPIDQAVEALDALAIGDTINFTDTGGAGSSFVGTSSASSIYSTLTTGTAITGVIITRDDYQIQLQVQSGLRDLSTTSDDVIISSSGNVFQIRRKRPAQTAAATEKPNVPNATRVLTTSSAHNGAAGELLAIWKGDKLLGVTRALAVTSDTITIPADESPFAIGNLSADWLQFFDQSATRYVNGPVNVSVRETTSFYLPGVTTGITTPADITLVTPKTDPASWLAEIAASTTWVPIEGSQLEVWRGPIYKQTVIEAQMSDALDTVAVNS